MGSAADRVARHDLETERERAERVAGLVGHVLAPAGSRCETCGLRRCPWCGFLELLGPGEVCGACRRARDAS